MNILRVLYGISERRRGAQVKLASRVLGPIEAWHYFGTAGEPSLASPWVGTSGASPGYRKDPDGFVYLKGSLTIIRAGPTGYAQAFSFGAFTLPVGYRPPALTILQSVLVTVQGQYRTNIVCYSSGYVQITSLDQDTYTATVSLDSHRFRLR
jgi:hypothetical protein